MCVMVYVMSLPQRSSGASGLNCRRSLLGDMILDPALRARAKKPDLGLYPDVLHLSPDSVHPARLPTVLQVKVDLAII